MLQVDPDSILIGNGSDDILTILTRAFVPEGGLIVAPTPSYILYESLAEIQGARFETVRYENNWTLPVARWPFPDAHITFVPNPNSPTGTTLPTSALLVLSQALRGPLVLDEAYAEFAAESSVPWVRRYPHLFVARTFSKAEGLAGLRLGAVIGQRGSLALVRRAMPPYPVNITARRCCPRSTG